jgi:hypothetical protein
MLSRLALLWTNSTNPFAQTVSREVPRDQWDGALTVGCFKKDPFCDPLLHGYKRLEDLNRGL